MDKMIGFIIWVVVGLGLIGIGISAFFRKEAVGFWANIKTKPVNDIRKYNCAVVKLFIAYGVIFILLGLPLLAGQNSPLALISVLGVVLESIIMMIIYSLHIEKKYKAK